MNSNVRRTLDRLYRNCHYLRYSERGNDILITYFKDSSLYPLEKIIVKLDKKNKKVCKYNIKEQFEPFTKEEIEVLNKLGYDICNELSNYIMEERDFLSESVRVRHLRVINSTLNIIKKEECLTPEDKSRLFFYLAGYDTDTYYNAVNELKATYAYNLTYRQIGDICKLSFSTVSRLLSGDSKISVKSIEAFCEGLGMADSEKRRLMILSGKLDILDYEVNKRIKEIYFSKRKDLNLNKDRLAEQIDVKRDTLSRIFSGKRNVYPKEVLRICVCLKCKAIEIEEMLKLVGVIEVVSTPIFEVIEEIDKNGYSNPDSLDKLMAKL